MIRREITFPPGLHAPCHRPELRLAVLTRNRNDPRFDFVVDTGADVSMVPIARAGRYGFAGYDSAAEAVPLTTSLNGRLRGQWGTLTVRRHTSGTLTLPCFYYTRDLGRDWYGRWMPHWLRGTPDHGPRLLGRAGVLDGWSFLIERGVHGFYDRPGIEPGANG